MSREYHRPAPPIQSLAVKLPQQFQPYLNPPWGDTNPGYDPLITRLNWMDRATTTTEEKKKANDEQKTLLRKLITDYTERAYTHSENNDPIQFISETYFIHKILDTYDPEMVRYVLEDMCKYPHDETSHAKQHPRSIIVTLLHRMRSRADTLLKTWADERDQSEYELTHKTKQITLEDEIGTIFFSQKYGNNSGGGNIMLYASTIQVILDRVDDDTKLYITKQLISKVDRQPLPGKVQIDKAESDSINKKISEIFTRYLPEERQDKTKTLSVPAELFAGILKFSEVVGNEVEEYDVTQPKSSWERRMRNLFSSPKHRA